jgi:hypothetical protein
MNAASNAVFQSLDHQDCLLAFKEALYCLVGGCVKNSRAFGVTINIILDAPVKHPQTQR